MNKISSTVKILIVSTLLVLGTHYVFADWVGPTATPPQNNVAAPINVGVDGQIKSGGLTVGTGSGVQYGLVVANGNVGFGTVSPAAGLNITKGFAVGGLGTAAINTTNGSQRTIQLATQNGINGGTYDNHTGALIWSTLESGGWGDGRLKIALPVDWGSYNTSNPAFVLGQNESSFAGIRLAIGLGSRTSGDDGAAGRLDFRGYDPTSFSIVGAGTYPTRKVHIYDQLNVDSICKGDGTNCFTPGTAGGFWADAGSGNIRNTNTGNVGIGTANPVGHVASRKALILADTTNDALMEIWGSQGSKSVFQNAAGATYMGNLVKGSGSGSTYLTYGNGVAAVTIDGGTGIVAIGNKATSASTVDADAATTLVTKDYLLSKVGSGIPTLQQVTDAGAVSTNVVTLAGLTMGQGSNAATINSVNRLHIQAGEALYLNPFSGPGNQDVIVGGGGGNGHLSVLGALAVGTNAIVSGNIGVGTGNPISKFNMVGGKAVFDSTNGGYGQVQVLNTSSGEASIVMANNVSSGQGGSVVSSSGNSNVWAFGVAPFGLTGDKFAIGTAALGAELTLSGSSGNVGIGMQPTTGNKLDVNGGITAGSRVHVGYNGNEGGNALVQFHTSGSCPPAIPGDPVPPTTGGLCPGNGIIRSSTGPYDDTNGALTFQAYSFKFDGGSMQFGDSVYIYSSSNSNGNSKLQINGNVRSTTLFNAPQLCINGDCRSSWASVSDIKLKKDIAPLQNALASIMKLRSVTYEFKDETYGKGHQTGLIAQEVEKVFPEFVTTDSKGNKAIYYDKLVSPLIGAVQDQQSQIEDLKKKNDDLEQRLEKLENNK